MTEYHYYHRYLRLLREIERLEKTHASTPYRKSMFSWEKNSSYLGEQMRISLKRKLADYLEEDKKSSPCEINGRVVTIDWIVDGMPSKRRKKAAADWMRQRNVIWDGHAPRLCREVRKAVEKNESIPHHCFDLRVQKTVQIKYISREAETLEATR